MQWPVKTLFTPDGFSDYALYIQCCPSADFSLLKQVDVVVEAHGAHGDGADSEGANSVPWKPRQRIVVHRLCI